MKRHAKAPSVGSMSSQADGPRSSVRRVFDTRGASRDAHKRFASSHRRPRTVSLGFVVAILVALTSAAPASAAGIHSPIPSLSHSGYTDGCGAAVDSHGDLYAADRGTVHIYGPGGTEITSFASNEACQLAVDSAGDVYAGEAVVVGFGAVHKYVPSSYPPTSGTTYELDKSINESSPGAHNGDGKIDPGLAVALAVDPVSGDLYTSHRIVDEKQTGTLTGMTDGATTFTIGNLPAFCASSTTGPITYSATGATRRDNIDNALEAACTNAPPQSGTATNGGNFKIGTAATPVITFQGELGGQDLALLNCTPSAGTCSFAPTTDGTPSYVAQYHSNGALVSKTIGTGLHGADYSGIDVYGANGRVYAFDSVHDQIAIIPAGAASPLSTISGTSTPAGSIGIGLVNKSTALAVDQATGHPYIYDAAHNVVDEFKPNGDYVTQLSNSFADGEPSDVAVDNSGGANDGDVYVVSLHGVDAFGAMSYDEVQPQLTVLKSGSGSGLVTGGSPASPSAVNCGSTCLVEFAKGDEVTLTATPAAGSTFTGWSDCDSPSGNQCTVTMSVDKSVTANFSSRHLTVAKNGSGSGTVTASPNGAPQASAAISCGSTCSADYVDGTVVTLTAGASPGSGLKQWSGCDSVAANQCTVTMSADKVITATFVAAPVVSGTQASGVSAHTATLEGQVNPEGATTTWHFEYVDDADFQSSGFVNAIKKPLPDASAGAGAQPIPVSASLGGLATTTTYHYRLFATNLGGTSEGPAGTFVTYSEAPSFDSCPNDVYRTGAGARLPDCRAYEQATPVDKNGSNASGGIGKVYVSVNGDAVTFNVIGGAPGAVGAQRLQTFIARRGSENWSSQGLFPPPSFGSNAGIMGWTLDLQHVYSGGQPVAKTWSLIEQDTTATSKFTLVHAAPPPPSLQSTFIGTSEGGSKLFFSNGENTADFSGEPPRGFPLTPDAAPGVGNVYVWDRDTSTLTLVGKVPASGDTSCGAGGPACVVPSEGTGSLFYLNYDGFTQQMHMVSDNGDQVVFNAEGGARQLYARENPSSSDASTVQVSASQRTDCADHNPCNGTPEPDPFGKRRPEFLFGTPSGSKVFFSSPEELTDDANTGPPADLPALGRADLDGSNGIKSFISLVSAKGIGNVDTDTDHIYWSDENTDSIGRADVNPATCSPNPVPCNVDPSFITGADNPVGIAVHPDSDGAGPDKDYLFWTNADDHAIDTGSGSIGRAELNGDGAATNVDQTFITGASDPAGIDTNAEHIYWSDQGTNPCCNGRSGGSIARANLDGTGVSQHFYDERSARGDVAVNGESIYFSNHSVSGSTPPDSDSVSRVNLDGSGKPQVVVNDTHETQAPSLALDGDHLYWGDFNGGKIGRQDLAGVEDPYADDVDSHGDLFVANRDGPISVYGPDGHLITHTFVPYNVGSGEVFEIAVDSQGFLYVNSGTFLSGGQNQILKFRPSNPGSAPTPSTTYSLDTSVGESSPGANNGDGVISADSAAAVAVDPSNDDVYVAHAAVDEVQAVSFLGMTSGTDTFTLSNLPPSCNSSTTAPITYRGPGTGIDPALEQACSGNPIGKDFRVSGGLSITIAFQGKFTGQNAAPLSCVASAGSCSITTETDGVSGFVSKHQPDGTLITDTIGTGVSGASYVGVDVYGSNHNVYVADDAHNKSYVFDAGDLTGLPGATIDGSNTPGGNISFDTGIVGNRGGHIDVDQSNGHLFLLDGTHNVLDQFDASGAWVSQLSNPQGGRGIAIDNSGGPAAGVIYIAHGRALNGSVNAVDAYDHSYNPLPNLSHTGYNTNFNFIPDAPDPVGLALGSGHLYWASGPPIPLHPGNDLYEWDRASQQLTDLSPDSTDPNGAEVQGAIGTSDDGSYLYFVANADLDGSGSATPGDCAQGIFPGSIVPLPYQSQGECNLYLWHRGDPVRFVARLNGKEDAADWARTFDTGTAISEAMNTGRVSADGGAVLFASTRQLTDYDNLGRSELYRYGIDSGLICISCNPTGAAPSGDAGLFSPGTQGGIAPATTVQTYPNNFSADGRRIFFETSDKLVAGDVNGVQDVYEWEAPESGSCRSTSSAYSSQDGGCLYLISAGSGSQASYFAGASTSGSDAFFFTLDALVPQDADGLVDIYDARVGGGLTAQHAVPRAGCTGDACRGQSTSAPSTSGAASAAFQGQGNPAIHRKPHKKKHHRKRHHHRRAASHHRRSHQ